MIYFDNAASSPPSEGALNTFLKISKNYYSNPASMSKAGMEAENIIIKSRKTIASLIGASSYDEIYFTSGGTESNNWAIFGTAEGYSRSGKHIVTTKTEHPATLSSYNVLSERGYDITYLDVDKNGLIDIDDVKKAIRTDTILVSIIHTNNETGVIQDIEKIGEAIKSVNTNTIYYVDAVQAFGKSKINVNKAKIDVLGSSGHKFHAPRGSGFLYMRNGLKIKPIIYGGGHQRGMRSGTENTAGAAAIAYCANELYSNINENNKKVFEIKRTLFEGIMESIPDVCLNGVDIFDTEKSSPYVLNIGFNGIRSEVLLHALEQKDIVVSAGSACDSHKKHYSTVLTAMGCDNKYIEGSIRFSFSHYNTVDEAIKTVEALKELIPALRRVSSMR